MKRGAIVAAALGVVLPLWLRQRRFERELISAVSRRTEEVNEFTQEVVCAYKEQADWGKQLVKEIEKALRP